MSTASTRPVVPASDPGPDLAGPGDQVAHVRAALRTRAPLVQCLTNFVSMEVVANVLNALGASPAMVHDPLESAEFAGIASAVSVNIGTPSPRRVEGMELAAEAASRAGTPWVLDPVAVGATAYRREVVARLLEHRPTVVRGNASEVLALSGPGARGRGVDSGDPTSAAAEAADALAAERHAVVVVTGETDLVTDGVRRVTVHGGHPLMPRVTALGCSLTAVVAACCAVVDDPFVAAVAASAVFSAAGARAGARAEGPGSMRTAFLDDLALVDDAALRAVRIVSA